MKITVTLAAMTALVMRFHKHRQAGLRHQSGAPSVGADVSLTYFGPPPSSVDPEVGRSPPE